jgi:glyoxylase-like metal-dependent hydrolase (beta-lactamase superfamily II)
LLDDGDTLSYGGRRLRLVLTPGHTPGHMCLWDDENQVLFLGDHVLYDISPNITTWPGFDDPLGRYVDSLVAVSAYPARIALPGHRGVSGTLSERVGAIIEHHGRRLREMLDALDACPGLTAWELAGKMSWNIRTDRGWEDFPPEQRWFAVSETDAHLEYLLRRGRVKCAEDGALLRYYSSK